jgi:hypothetical protein
LNAIILIEDELIPESSFLFEFICPYDRYCIVCAESNLLWHQQLYITKAMMPTARAPNMARLAPNPEAAPTAVGVAVAVDVVVAFAVLDAVAALAGSSAVPEVELVVDVVVVGVPASSSSPPSGPSDVGCTVVEFAAAV